MYQKGQNVRMTRDCDCGGFKKGDVFMLSRSHKSVAFFVDADGDDRCLEHSFELIPSLTIEPGKHYRTRSGKPTGRVTVGDTGFEAVVDGRVRIFDKAGGHVHGDDDIVEAWVPKVGERVRMTREVEGHMSECAATIIHDDGDEKLNLLIKFDRAQSWAHSAAGRAPDHHAYWVGASDLEPLPVAPQPAAPQPVALKIEAGRYYKTRDGRKVGPMVRDDWGDGQPWTDGERWYCEDGQWERSEINDNDLIVEWQETTNVGAQVDTLAEEYGPVVASNDTPERKLVRTGQGYGYELARFGDYVWVDTGKTAPITLRADKLAA